MGIGRKLNELLRDISPNYDFLIKGLEEIIALIWFAMILDIFYIVVSSMLCIFPGRQFNYATTDILLSCIGIIVFSEALKWILSKIKLN